MSDKVTTEGPSGAPGKTQEGEPSPPPDGQPKGPSTRKGPKAPKGVRKDKTEKPAGPSTAGAVQKDGPKSHSDGQKPKSGPQDSSSSGPPTQAALRSSYQRTRAQQFKKNIATFKTFAQFFALLVVTVPAASLDVQNYLLDHGYAYRTAQKAVGAHVFSHTLRETAVLRAFQTYAKSRGIGLKAMLVLDMYGSPRNDAFNYLPDSPLGAALKKADLVLKHVRVEDHSYVYDAAKGEINNRTSMEEAKWVVEEFRAAYGDTGRVVVLIQDVYYSSSPHDASRGVDPSSAARWMEELHADDAIHIARDFVGMAGCDEFVWKEIDQISGQVVKCKRTEAYWVQTNPNRPGEGIAFYSEDPRQLIRAGREVVSPYTAHPAHGFGTQEHHAVGSQGLSVYLVDTVPHSVAGGYHIRLLTKTSGIPRDSAPYPRVPDGFRQDTDGAWYYYPAIRKFRADARTTELTAYRSGLTLPAVKSVLETYHGYDLLDAIHSEWLNDVLLKTFDMLLTIDRKRVAQSVMDAKAELEDAEIGLRGVSSNTPQTLKGAMSMATQNLLTGAFQRASATTGMPMPAQGLVSAVRVGLVAGATMACAGASGYAACLSTPRVGTGKLSSFANWMGLGDKRYGEEDPYVADLITSYKHGNQEHWHETPRVVYLKPAVTLPPVTVFDDPEFIVPALGVVLKTTFQGRVVDSRVAYKFGQFEKGAYTLPVAHIVSPLASIAATPVSQYEMMRRLCESEIPSAADLTSRWESLVADISLMTIEGNSLLEVARLVSPDMRREFETIVAEATAGPRRRALNGKAAIERGDIPAPTTPVLPKTDETLAPKRNQYGKRVWTLRPIINVNPVFNAAITQVVDVLTTLLKTLFKGQLYVHKSAVPSRGDVEVVDTPVRIWYCSSMTVPDLCAAAAELVAIQDGVGLFVAGDDMFGVVAYCGEQLFFTNDYSKYDITQTESSWAAIVNFLTMAGLPTDELEEMLEILGADLVCVEKGPRKGGDLSVRYQLSRGVFQRSGSRATTAGNNIQGIFVGLAGLLSCYRRCVALGGIPADLEQVRKDLADDTLQFGFLAKAVVSRCWDGAEFLRGWFLPMEISTPMVSFSSPTYSDVRPIWLPLPGQALKMGKFRVKQGEMMTLEEYAYAIRRSYDFVPRSYPVFGALLALYDKLGGTSSEDPARLRTLQSRAIESFQYKPMWSSRQDGPLAVAIRSSLDGADNLDVVHMNVAARYGEENLDLIYGLDAHIRENVTKLGCVITHPAAEVLAMDYGWKPSVEGSSSGSSSEEA